MSSSRPFVHLHVHSDYSLLDGACELSRLVELAARQGMPAVALTDHGNLYGAVSFHQAARAAGIKPILGCELYVCKKEDHRAAPEGDSYNHLIVLAENETGYRNLVKIVSEASLHGFYYKPRISKKFLAQHSQGLIALSACLKGEVQEFLSQGKPEDAFRVAGEFRDIFGANNFFLEIQDQGLEQEHRIKDGLLELSRRTQLPLVATNDCHYLTHDDARMHDVLLCIQMGKRVQDENRMRFGSDQFFLKNTDEMLAVFGGVEEAVYRTADIAERCELKLKPVDSPFPEFTVPEGETIDSFFERMTREGFARREPRIAERRALGRTRYTRQEYQERLDREIRIIRDMKFPGYFLIVWDFIRHAKEQGIPVGPGRGSAAGSLVSFALGITDVDPLENELLFERFLNPERISMPDIDVDFCMNRRGEVIDYVTHKYGREQVSQIITFGTLAAKAAIKDVGRAMDLPYGEVDRIAKLVPNVVNITLESAMEQSPELQKLYDNDTRTRELLDVAKKVEGLCRHSGMHAAGVVIAPRPLTELVPLTRTNRDEIVTQYDMTGLEKIGLLKMDFLGLTTLTILDDAVRMINERNRRQGAAEVDLSNLPDEDALTYELFCKGLTSGVFQFESQGMRDILKRYRPERLSDLTALNALYRPGPIQGGMIDDFVERKHGRRKIEYLLPELEPILSETLGVFVYQEQVMQAANRLAGYSLGEADMLRRAMGKKKPEEMAKHREKFVAGAVERKLPKERTEQIFDLMAQFAGYGFNKSHSAAYAIVAYQTAYLKAHFPVEFMAALLTSSTGNTDNVVKYINECREMKIAVLPPAINHSAANFTPQGEAIRFGLSAIKNVGENAVAAILQARRDGGPFTTMYDFCARVASKVMNKRVIESLVKSGAMDEMAGDYQGGNPRAALFALIDRALEQAQKDEKAREIGQHGLFLSFGEPEQRRTAEPLPKVPEWDEATRLAYEKEILGFYVTGHPLDRVADLMDDLNLTPLDRLQGRRGKEETLVGGLLSGVQVKRNKKGEAWAVAQLEDRTGRVELLCFAEAYRRLETQIRMTVPVVVKAKLTEGDAEPKLQVQEIRELSGERPVLPRAVLVRLAVDELTEDRVADMARLLESRPGSAKIHVQARSASAGFEQVLEVGAGVTADARFRREVEALCGRGSVRVVD